MREALCGLHHEAKQDVSRDVLHNDAGELGQHVHEVLHQHAHATANLQHMDDLLAATAVSHWCTRSHQWIPTHVCIRMQFERELNAF